MDTFKWLDGRAAVFLVIFLVLVAAGIIVSFWIELPNPLDLLFGQ